MIECQICGRKLGNLTGKHLTSHGLSAQEYRDRYPGFPTTMPRVQSEVTKEKRAAKLRGRKLSEDTKAKIGAGNRGKVMDPQAVARQKASYRKFLDENGGSPQKGFKRSDQFKARMSEIARNRDPQLVQAKLEQMWEARRGSTATPEQRENYSAGRIKYMINNPDKLGRKLFNTIPELEFEKELIDRNIEFSKSVHIGNRVFDFKIGTNILVEIDGPYHRRLGMYLAIDASDDEKVTKLMHIIERDRNKDKMARSAGYFVYRIPVGQHLPKDWYQVLVDQGFTDL